MISTLRKTSGTSPATTRTASPSTSAVLPTPASPTMIGLFFRRRARMSTICRISRSRPKMGSISPARARRIEVVVHHEERDVALGVVEQLQASGARPSPRSGGR
jgi:hypothetical protein